MQELLDRYSAELEAKTLIVVSKGRIRIRH